MMRRRRLLQAGIAATAAAAFGSTAGRSAGAPITVPPALNFRSFEVTTTVDLAEPKGAAQLWLPVFQTAGSYQKLLGISWGGNAAIRLDHDPIYGASVLHARWRDDGAPRRITVVQRVATRERSDSDASQALSAAERRLWTESGPAMPTDGIVRDTARRIIGNLRQPEARLRAIYDWVVTNTWRDATVPGCGTGDIAGMLREGRFGGKCADINSLMVGLCRAVGLPARDVYGIRLADSKLFKCLGRGGDITGAQHCRAEAYLEHKGWFPVDPADVRKAILEEKLPLNSPPIARLTDHLFGAWESNWAGFNSATGVRLADAPHTPNFDFLMYPCAMTAESTLSGLDAAHFSYRITSTEIPV